MSLLNFKGVRELTVDFDEHETNIFGANHTGKTTLFDAFVWLMFDKDSQDRQNFGIRTYDESGNIIPKLPHEVSACIEVNGVEINLKRCFVENWTKKRGSQEAVYDGNSEERYWNDVPCSKTEFAKKIADICDESIFKLITNPLYFPSMKPAIQRGMLFQMAGDLTDADVAASDQEKFANLAEQLSHKTLDEYKREIGAKKKRIKEAIETIPARIDENKRQMPEAEDWSALEKDIKEKEAKIRELDGQISDEGKAYQAKAQETASKAKELAEKKRQRAVREGAVRDELLKDFYKQTEDYNNRRIAAQQQNFDISQRRRMAESDIRREKEVIISLQCDINEREQRLNRLRDEWHSIKAREFNPENLETVCPHCGRPYEQSQIDRSIEEQRQAYNAHTSHLLSENKTNGQKVAAEVAQLKESIAKSEAVIKEKEALLESLVENPFTETAPTQPDITSGIASDAELQQIDKEIAALEAEIAKPIEKPDTDFLTDGKNLLLDGIEDERKRLAKRDTIAATLKRIEELEKELKKNNEALTELEGIEFNILEFGKAKVAMVEGKINSLFSIVKFKMYERQINGGEVETCECMMHGTPYSVLSNSEKINAGLDIINAICRANEVHAPIFIDNRESATDIIDVDSQVINLIVDASCTKFRVQ
jgi:DNA repair exonuclease SbcCD ATPase subunit